MLQVLLTSTLIVAAVASLLWCAADAWVAARMRRPSPVAIAAVLAAAAVAGWLRWGFVPAHHAMYVDEPWYAEAACRLIESGSLEICAERWSGPACESFGKAPGWPVLLGAWMGIRGCDAAAGIELNRILGTTSVVLVALLAIAAGATGGQAALAAGLLAVHPVHVAWSATGESNVAAACTIAAALCGAVWFAAAPRNSAATLAIAGFGAATTIRPEIFAVALVVATGLVVADRGALRVALALIAAAGLAALGASPLWAMNESISGGGFLSLANLSANAHRLDWSLVLLASCGVAALVGRGRGAASLLLAAAGLGACAVVLAYDRFAPRMLLPAIVALLPLCATATGLVTERLRGAAMVGVFGLAVTVWMGPLRAAAAPSETQLLELRVARRAGEWSRTNGDPLIVAEEPTVLAAAGARRVMSSREAVAGEERLRAAVAGGEPIYFLRDMYCEQGYAGGDSSTRCARLLEQFATSAVLEERLHARTYALHRLEARP